MREIVNGFQLLTIFAKSFILGVWQGSENASVLQESLRSLILEIAHKKSIHPHFRPMLPLNAPLKNQKTCVLESLFNKVYR